MSLYELEDLLKNVTGLPTMRFAMRTKQHGHLATFAIELTMDSVDVHTGRPMPLLSVHEMMPEQLARMDERSVVLLLRDLMVRMMVHETNEHILVYGRRAFNPHKSGGWQQKVLEKALAEKDGRFLQSPYLRDEMELYDQAPHARRRKSGP